MQLSLTKAACLPESDGLHHLGTAERMLNSCRTELRRCIWDLRNDALDRPTFDEALSKALVPAIGRAKLTVDFKVPRSRISDTTAHSIICIVRELAANAARHRAAGAIAKDAPNDELIAAIFTMADGGSAFSEDIARYTEEEPKPPELSQRQSEILHAITRGLTNRDIAIQLGVSADCIKQHLNAIYHKLGAATRSEAVAIALRKQLIKF